MAILKQMKLKTEAALKAIGIVLGMNVIVFAIRFIARWIGLKPGVDYRATYTPGGIYVMQIAFLMLAFFYYRSKVKGD